MRRIARKICAAMGIPHQTDIQYKKMKKIYKSAKGEL
jgi:hypothetical protein